MPTTSDQTTSSLPLRTAMESRDLAAALDAFAPEAVFHSPLTDRLAVTGREQIGAVIEMVLATFEGLHYTAEARSGDTAFLVGRAKIAGTEIELVDHMTLGPDGKIRVLTVFFRPLPAAARAMRVIGAEFGRRKSPARAAVISGLTRPLGALTRIGDPIGARLIRSTLP